MKIDAHHHFWKYDPKEYGWINENMKAIRRDFLVPELTAALGSAGVDGAISVQARQTLEETRWLLEIASREKIIRGVVGWVDLASPNVDSQLARFASNRKLRGVRHVLQEEPADQLMDDPKFNAGVARLRNYGLVYDVLIFERHLKQALRFIDRHPGQIFVLDHVAKPRIREHVLGDWVTGIREFARRPNTYCKVSGMVTEADWRHWKPADLKPYIATVMEAFTPKRLMFGSDWPVALVASDYKRWHDTVAAEVAMLSRQEQDRFWSGTATEAYSLP